MAPAFESTARPPSPQPFEPSQRAIPPPPQQPPATRATPKSTSKPKAPPVRADWVNTLWADVSGQLHRFSVISPDLFDGLLLRKTTGTGKLIQSHLKNKHQELGDDRNLATVRVVAPQVMIGEVWRLVWTIKRPRNPNGHQYHSESEFLLPPFIRDYGPGPAEFDPEPESEFDVVVRGIMADADRRMGVDCESGADGMGAGVSVDDGMV